MGRWRRRKRAGKFVSNAIFSPAKGYEINLRTADALEADRREAIAASAYARGVRGQKNFEKLWSPTAAAKATVRAMKAPAPTPAPAAAKRAAPPPTPPAPGLDPEMDADPDDDDDDFEGGEASAGDESAAPAAAPVAPVPSGQTAAAGNSAPAAAPVVEPLHVAAAAAAAETTAVKGEVVEPPKDRKALREEKTRAALADVESKLSKFSEKFGDEIFDGAAGWLLWFEGWCAAKGVNWRLKREGFPDRVEAGPVEEGTIEREILGLGLKGVAIKRAPWLLDALTPEWAIVAGLALGVPSALKGLQPAAPAAAQRANGERPRPRPVPDAPAPAAPPASEPPPASA